MTIDAVDLADNRLLALGPGTATVDPQTQLTRGADGVMQGVGGPDTAHQFFIGDGPQIELGCTGLPHGPAVISYTVRDEDLAGVTCLLDDGPGEEIPVGEGVTVIEGTREVGARGTHKFTVRATDKAENPPSERSLVFTIDPSPQISLTKSGPAQGPVTVTYRVTDKDLARVRFTLDGQSIEIPADGRTTINGSRVVTAVGSHTATVTAWASDAEDHIGEKTITFKIAPKPPQSPPPPPGTNDTPPTPPRCDESFDISDSLYGPGLACPFETTSLGLLQSGYWQDMAALLGSFGRRAEEIPPENFSAILAERYRVILVPSGGLQPIAYLEGMREKFAAYLEAGGTLIVFAQPTADDYKVLPGPVAGLGYVEDTACHSLTGAIVKYNPAFAGQKDATVDGNADGILTSWPENAETWLKRIKNGFPALLSYQYGQGRVIISTYYSDFAYSHSQLHDDERRLLRDLLAWNATPNKDNIPEVRPGGSANLQVPVIALDDMVGLAAKVRLLLRDPDSKLVETREYELALEPGGTVEVPYLFSDAGGALAQDEKRLGIWNVDYELLGADGRVVQAERVAMAVALGKHLEGVGTAAIGATVSTPMSAPYGRPMPFRLIVTNNHSEIRDVQYRIHHHAWLNLGTVSGHFSVAAGETKEVKIPVTPLQPSLSPSSPNWYRIEFLSAGEIIARELRPVYVYAPMVRVAYACENITRLELRAGDPRSGQQTAAAQPGDRLKVSVTLTNPSPVEIPGHWHFEVQSPGGQILYREHFDLTLGANGNHIKAFEFDLPTDPCPGYYRYTLSWTTEDGSVWFQI
ncbi:MAG: hypothetical protein ACUVRM_06435 [Bacillota bacterium]